MQPSQFDDCWIGYYSATGKTSGVPGSPCSKCPSGSTNEYYGMTNCDKCLPGYFKNATSSNHPSKCFACPVNYYSDYDSTYCFSCVGTAPCIPACPAGSYQVPGSFICQSCPAGTYSGSMASACKPCPAGLYSLEGATSCIACNAGTFSSGNSAACTACPTGEFSYPGASSCSSCSSE